MNVETKTVVTVTAMAKMVGLSRARFYQLIKAGVFPSPVYSVSTRRPIYVEELQELCLEVRRRNCGVNGQPVVFYSRRTTAVPTTKRKRPPRATNNNADIIKGLKSLGLTSVSSSEVEAAMKSAFPDGVNGHAQGEVVRRIFLSIKRQDRAGNVGR